MKRSLYGNTQPFSDGKQRLERLLLRGAGIELPPRLTVPKRDDSEPCLLTAGQEHLWHASRSGLAGEACNEVVLLRFLGLLNVIALTESLNEMVRRHEILRTRFVQVDGQLRQHVSAGLKIKVSLTDLTRASAREQIATWERLRGEEAGRRFKLEDIPLLWCVLVMLSPEEQLLILTLHKIICDRWSRNLLVNEMGQLYESLVTGEPHELSEPQIQYGDFAMWQWRRLEAGERDRAIKYSMGKLGGELSSANTAPRLSMPPCHGMASHKVGLSDATSWRVSQIGSSQNMTASMILLAGWHVLLSHYSGREEVTVGMVAANRDRVESQTLIGPVSTTLLIKLDLKGNPSFREVMRRVREAVIEALELKEPSYELILAGVSGEEDARRSPSADAMFLMEEAVSEVVNFGGLKVVEEKTDQCISNDHLALVMLHVSGRFEGRIEYDPTLFADEEVIRMTAGYERLIEIIVSDPDCRIRNLPPLVDLPPGR
jgi:hypothetical protein